MPQNITDVDVFTDPVEAPAGSDVGSSAFWLALLQKYANRTRYLHERLFESTPPAQQTFLHATSAFGVESVGSGAHPWIRQAFGSPPNQGFRLASNADLASLIWRLNDHLPSGAIVSEVTAFVAPGASRSAQSSTPGDNGRMVLSRFVEGLGVAPTLAYTGPVDAVEDGGGTSLQAIVMTAGSPFTVLKGVFDPGSGDAVFSHCVHLVCGDDAGTNRDKVHGILIDWTDPGIASR